ncbi:IS5 family transposase [Streptomyces sp. NBRC 110028]|uniref:IS5 family transposase n=1 Tax=Streptomyces sp. NBRC 110028 TaxID=1621260 RepID=UPI00099E34BB|nr:IS5 family transposase [Streptomyces sp. NBRC 110028]
MSRPQLSHAEWEFISAFLPVGEYGPYPENLRAHFEGVVWRFRNGAKWRELPERFGHWSTVYGRFRQWRDAGVFTTLFEERRRVRRRRRARLAAAGLSRSRGGLTTKKHLSCVPQCLPLSLTITAGQAGDSPQFIPVLNKIRVPGPVGRPRTRPDAVAGDKAYSSRQNRSHLRKRGIKTVIPEKKDQAAHRENRGSRGGRPVTWDKQLYKLRNSVERTISKIKDWRGLAVRYDKKPESYQAGLELCAGLLWIRHLGSQP